MNDTPEHPAEQDGKIAPTEITGPAVLRVKKPIPLHGGGETPVGTEVYAGPVQAKKLVAEGLAEVVQVFGARQSSSACERWDTVDGQRERLELERQEITQENQAERGVREMDAKVIRDHLAALKGFIREFVTKYTDGSVAPDDPDLDHRIFEWQEQFGRGKVPPELRGGGLEDDPSKFGDLGYYSLLVSQIQQNIEQGLGSGLPAGHLFADTLLAELRTEELRSEGRESEADEQQRQVNIRKIEVARGYEEGFPQLLTALRLALGLLASMDPEHLIRGARQLVHAREAGSAAKYARGIQAAVDHVYRPGMKEQECQDALLALIREGFEAENGRYELYLDSADGTVVIVQRDLDAGLERSLQLGSFHPYFVRARDAQSP